MTRDKAENVVLCVKDSENDRVLLSGASTQMNNWPETNDSLISRIKDSADEVAWAQFLAIYRPVIVRLGVSQGLQHADADDLAQQVFVSVAGAIDRWQPTRSGKQFRYWLNRVARNAIINAMARVPPDRGAGSTEIDNLLVEVADQPLSREILAEAHMEAIRWAASEIEHEFSDATWQMFWHSTVNGKTVDQVAKLSGKSVGAVYIARCRVTKRLKEVVQQSSALWGEQE